MQVQWLSVCGIQHRLRVPPAQNLKMFSLIIAGGVDFQSSNLCLITLPIMVSHMIRSALMQGVAAKAYAMLGTISVRIIYTV